MKKQLLPGNWSRTSETEMLRCWQDIEGWHQMESIKLLKGDNCQQSVICILHHHLHPPQHLSKVKNIHFCHFLRKRIVGDKICSFLLWTAQSEVSEASIQHFVVDWVTTVSCCSVLLRIKFPVRLIVIILTLLRVLAPIFLFYILPIVILQTTMFKVKHKRCSLHLKTLEDDSAEEGHNQMSFFSDESTEALDYKSDLQNHSGSSDFCKVSSSC